MWVDEKVKQSSLIVVSVWVDEKVKQCFVKKVHVFIWHWLDILICHGYHFINQYFYYKKYLIWSQFS